MTESGSAPGTEKHGGTAAALPHLLCGLCPDAPSYRKPSSITPAWESLYHAEAQYLLHLGVSSPHLPCRDHVGGRQQLWGGMWGRNGLPGTICLRCALVPDRSALIVLCSLALSHAGPVLRVKSQPLPWPSSLVPAGGGGGGADQLH